MDRNVETVAALYDQASARLPFVRLWLDSYTSRYTKYLDNPRIRHEVMNSPSIAAQATAARILRDIAWVRRRKPEVDSMGPFDRRQIMRASMILAQDERVPWLRNILRNHTSVVDRAVVRWLLAQ